MRIFLSWSGEKSKKVAIILKKWLSMLSPRNFKPFVSSEDIISGSFWHENLQRALKESNCGILCLTRENFAEPWLLYEAGALSKLGATQVVPFLIDVEKSVIPDPLRHLQAVTFCKDEIRQMVLDFGNSCKDNTPGWRELVIAGFDSFYAKLEEPLKELLANDNAPQKDASDNSESQMLRASLEIAQRNAENIETILRMQSQQSQATAALKRKMDFQLGMLSRNSLRQSVENFRSTLCGLQGFAQESYYKKGMSVWETLHSRDSVNAIGELTLFESNLKDCIARCYIQEASLPPEAKKVVDVMFALLISIADIRRELERGLK